LGAGAIFFSDAGTTADGMDSLLTERGSPVNSPPKAFFLPVAGPATRPLTTWVPGAGADDRLQLRHSFDTAVSASSLQSVASTGGSSSKSDLINRDVGLSSCDDNSEMVTDTHIDDVIVDDNDDDDDDGGDDDDDLLEHSPVTPSHAHRHTVSLCATPTVTVTPATTQQPQLAPLLPVHMFAVLGFLQNVTNLPRGMQRTRVIGEH
jgi:hypothetical protein